MAAVVNTKSSSSGSARKRGLGAAGDQDGRQRPWPVASRPQQSPLVGAFQRLLQIARSPIPVRSGVSPASRTAVYGPVCTVVWEGWSREASPYPDPWRKTTCTGRKGTAAVGPGADVRRPPSVQIGGFTPWLSRATMCSSLALARERSTDRTRRRCRRRRLGHLQ